MFNINCDLKSKLAKIWTELFNDDPLTIVNEERRREETDLKGISTYH